MLALVRLLLVVFLLGLAVRTVLSWLRGLASAAGRPAPPPAGVPMVRDRVCNTFVPRDHALSATIAGREEFFCSERCRARALSGLLGNPPRGTP
jgi:hypothetical protein